MNLNRDEFLLLSRSGRGLHSTRAGPPPDQPEGARGRWRLRRRETSASRTRGYADERAYHELEFLVGFPAEEESLL